jgi:DNA-directed RNA polymerase omega subunit
MTESNDLQAEVSGRKGKKMELPIDQLREKTGSAYKLVILASRRALELSENPAAKLIDADPGAKAQDIALKEILEGKISFKIKEKKQ